METLKDRWMDGLGTVPATERLGGDDDDGEGTTRGCGYGLDVGQVL